MKDAKRIIVNQIKNKITIRLGSEACSGSDEILDALAYACTFYAPRRFSDIEMDARNWNELADTLTIVELMKVQDSLTRFRAGNNRLFYILGCFARVYGRRVSGSGMRRSDHRERHYTKSELDQIVRTQNAFSEADL